MCRETPSLFSLTSSCFRLHLQKTTDCFSGVKNQTEIFFKKLELMFASLLNTTIFSERGWSQRLREKEVFSEGKCRFLSSPPCSWVSPPVGFVWGWGLYSASFSIFPGKEDIKKKVPTIWMFVALMNTGIFAWIPSNNWHFPMCLISTLAKLLAWTNMWKMVNSTMLLEREQ